MVMPPTMGLIPTTRALVRFKASLTPSSAKIVPILTMGLLGQTTTVSASNIAFKTSGEGLAVVAPTNSTPKTSSFVCLRTKYSSK